MIDYFAVLGQPRRPWIDPGKLKEEYQRQTKAEHPDVKESRRTKASPTFADVNEAYRVLMNPRLRLKHLLTLEGAAPAPAASVPAEVTDLFSETGELVREIDCLLREMAAANNALSKSVLRPKLKRMRERTNIFLKRLETLYENGIQELAQLDTAWDGQPDKVIGKLSGLYRRFAYLERWMGQLRERQFQLSV